MKRLGLLLLLTGCVHAPPRFFPAKAEASPLGAVFTCGARAHSKDEALRAAEGQCNEVICQHCGAEGFELCRVVRNGGLNIKQKRSECDGQSCTAHISVLYTKADEAAECPSYRDNRLSNAKACTADMNAFAATLGTTSQAMIERHALLRSALIHCANLEPPLDAALTTGLNNFEHAKELREWLTTYAPLRAQISDGKRFTDRIRATIPYITNKQYVLAVIEAVDALDVQRVLDTFAVVPPGAFYGAPNVHFDAYEKLMARLSPEQLAPVTAFMDATYPTPADWKDFNRRRHPRPPHVPSGQNP